MSIKRLAAFVLLAGLIAMLSLNIANGPKTIQYIVLSPAAEKPQQEDADGDQQQQQEEGQEKAEVKKEKLTTLQEWLKALTTRLQDQAGLIHSWGVTSYNSRVSLTDGDQGSATAALQGMYGDASLQGTDVLTFGRQLYPEELEQGRRVAVINERVALDLFRVGDPVDRKLVLGEEEYTVVGIVRRARSTGDMEEGLVRVPLLALNAQGFQTTQLAVDLLPQTGAGAYAALQKEMEQWQAGGTYHSLTKERYRAMLPVRYLLCAAGLLLCSLGIRWTNAFARSQSQRVRERMESRYAVRMLPEMLGRLLMILVLYGVFIGGIAWALLEAIAPVYTFPEWVPTVLVEPTEISKTFWALRTQETALVSLRTPELLRLKYLHRLMLIACTAAGLLLYRPYLKIKEAVRGA